MYLYILYIEPFLQHLKHSLKQVKIFNYNLEISAFVDDITVFINNKRDLKTLENCIANFEQATNAKINREKTQVLKLGDWGNEDQTERRVFNHLP